jgi:predicted acylesterase/phospholipase RssA
VLPRKAVPQDAVNSAVIPGLPCVRVWGDGEALGVAAWMRQKIEREWAYRGLTAGAALPDIAMLALSGGGQNGAFGAGVLCGWSTHGDRPDFNIVTGVSAGALIAPFAFVGSDFDFVLREVFTTAKTADIAQERGIVGGLLGESLYDSRPLRTLLSTYIDADFLARVAQEHAKGRELLIGTTNLDTGRPVIWSMGTIAASGRDADRGLFIDVLVASAAIPGVFPPVMIGVEHDGIRFDEMHVDGGTTTQVFLYPPTFDLHAFVRDLRVARNRTVYVIRNAGLDTAYAPVRRRTLPIAQRAVSSLIESQGIGDLYRIYLESKRDGVAFRLATIPEGADQETPEMFEPAYMKSLFDRGHDLAARGYPWAEAPPGFESMEERMQRLVPNPADPAK